MYFGNDDLVYQNQMLQEVQTPEISYSTTIIFNIKSSTHLKTVINKVVWLLETRDPLVVIRDNINRVNKDGIVCNVLLEGPNES